MKAHFKRPRRLRECLSICSKLPIRLAGGLLQGAAIALLLLIASSVITAAQNQPSAAALTSLVQQAESALDDMRYADALVAFSRAASLAPQDASVCFGAGYASAMLGRMSDAAAWLARAVALRPRFLEADTLLGEVLYRQGKVAEAFEVYERALEYAPRNQALIAGRDKWRREADVTGRFYEATGAHFAVRFEGPADDVAARRVVGILEQAYLRIGSALSTYPTEAVTVVLYTKQQFRDITRSPEWAGGVFDGRIKIPTAGASEGSDDLRRILEHEYVHALVATLAGPTVPPWLNEGLATSLEPGGLESAEAVLKRDSRRLSYAQLERGFGGFTPAQAAVAYAQSAVAVRKLRDLRGDAAIVTLLRALGDGVPFETAFHAAMLMRLDELQALMARL